MALGFWRRSNGSAIEYFALAAGLTAIAALFVGYSAQQVASEGGLPTIAFLGADEYVAKKSRSPNFNAIDYATTGSIRGQVVVLDPCTGSQKPE
jgi:hypothetical protein